MKFSFVSRLHLRRWTGKCEN